MITIVLLGEVGCPGSGASVRICPGVGLASRSGAIWVFRAMICEDRMVFCASAYARSVEFGRAAWRSAR